MIISVTEKPLYKRCRRKWNFESSNRMALQPMVPATALALGTFVHAALGEWAENPDKRPKQTFLESARDARNDVQRRYEEQTGTKLPDSKLGSIDDGIAMGYAMMENYEAHWKSPLPPGFTLIAQEQRIVVPIPFTEHTSEYVYNKESGLAELVQYPDVRMHYLQGRIDAIIKDKRDMLYVLDHKTYSQRPRAEVLRSTDQFVGYQWMLTQIDLGYNVAGVAYDGLWKRAAVPKKVDNRDGVMSDLFCRMLIEHGPSVLAEFQAELREEVIEMANNPYIYKNRTTDGSCFWGCGMESLCSAVSHDEDVDYLLRTEYTTKQQDADLNTKEDDAA